MTQLALGWTPMPLGDLAEFVMGQAPPGDSYNTDGNGVPFVRAGEFGSLRPAIEHWTTTPLKHARTSDVLICVVGATAGKVNLGVDAAIGRSVAAVRPRPRLDQRFLYHFLTSQVSVLRTGSRGSAQGVIARRDLQDVLVPVPPLDEQQGIVSILEDHLSRLDAAVDYLATAAHRSRTLAAARLTGLVSPRDPIVELGALTRSSGYGTSTKCSPGGPGVAVVRIPNLRGGAVDLADEKRAADPTLDLSGLMLTPGDLLVVRTNGSRDLIGRTAIVQPEVEASFASYLIRYQLDRARVRPEWVHLMLARPHARRTLEGLAASSAGQYNLSLAKLDRVPIPSPSLAEQDARITEHEVAQGAAEQVSRALATAHRRSTSLRRALLAAAFSGRLTGHASDMDRAEELAS